MKNKKSVLAGVLALVLTTATIGVPFVSNDSQTKEPAEPLKITYELTKENEYVTTMEIDVPEEISADIAELYVNGIYVDKTLLPTENKLRSSPIVFTDEKRLEIKLFKLGEHIGTARLDEGVIK